MTAPHPGQAKPRRYGLVNASDAATHLRRAYGLRIAPATIRKWASRHKIPTHGLRRERYDLREVIEHAERAGLLGA